MHVWLGGYEVKFYHIPLAPLTEFGMWTWEKFLDELAKLADRYWDKGEC
jgi:hypothetical protein